MPYMKIQLPMMFAVRPRKPKTSGGMMANFTALKLARDWALGQFYFHVMAAYAILRQRGVVLGKADFVPHMLAYLRSGTEPRG